MENETKTMLQEATEQHKELEKLFDKLKNAQGMANQKTVMFEIYQSLLDHNTKLFDENLALKIRLRDLTIN